MKVRICPYDMTSKSALALSKELTERLGYYVYRGKALPGRINIGWGAKKQVDGVPWFNAPKFINNARDKRAAFTMWSKSGVAHVPYTTAKKDAQKWLDAGSKVFARSAGGQAGSGITIVSPGEDLPSKPLYTRHIPSTHEFRVNVVRDKVTIVQEKRKKNGVVADNLIRAIEHKGWCFCIKNVVEPAGLRELGVKAVGALGLDFGAVDIIYDKPTKKLYVLEVNTAPGYVFGSTAMKEFADEVAKTLAQ